VRGEDRIPGSGHHWCGTSFLRMQESNPTVVYRRGPTGGALGNAQVSCGHYDRFARDEYAVARKAHLQNAPA
jgi:hypothetical protein